MYHAMMLSVYVVTLVDRELEQCIGSAYSFVDAIDRFWENQKILMFRLSSTVMIMHADFNRL